MMLNVFDVVNGSRPAPSKDDPQYLRWAQRDNAAVFSIMSTLDESIVRSIPREASTSKAIWEILSTRYITGNTQAAFTKFKSFFTYSIVDGVPLTQQLDELSRIWNEIAESGILDNKETLRVFGLLTALPESYAKLVDPILAVTSFKELSYDTVYAKVLANATARSIPSSSAVRTAAPTDSADRKKKATCHYCKKKGHYVSECRKKKKDEEEKKNSTTAAVHVITAEASSSMPANVAASFYVAGSVPWMLDSGCTQHMTPHLSDFSEYHEFEL